MSCHYCYHKGLYHFQLLTVEKYCKMVIRNQLNHHLRFFSELILLLLLIPLLKEPLTLKAKIRSLSPSPRVSDVQPRKWPRASCACLLIVNGIHISRKKKNDKSCFVLVFYMVLGLNFSTWAYIL
jgi:hypothetical protein